MSRHAAPAAPPAEPLALPAGFVQGDPGPLPYGPSYGEWLINQVDPAPAGQPGDGEAQGDAGLFAAPPVGLPGRINPAPVVTVAGVELPGSVPPGADLAGLVVLDDVRVPWGTDSPVDQADPATGSLTLIDFTLTWAVDQDVIGIPVTVGWRTATAARTIFRGRVTDVDLARTSVRRKDGESVPAVLVDLKLASIETDLANRRPSEAAWPAETLAARAARIAAYTTGVVSSMTVRTQDWGACQAAANGSVGQTSIRDLVLQLYNSTGGDRLVYSPHKQTYEHLGRRSVPARTLQRLSFGIDDHPRVGQGVWIGPNVVRKATGVDPELPATALYLDAAFLEYNDGLTRSAANRITRVAVTSKDSAAADATRTTTRVDPTANEAVTGQRALTLDSLHNWNDFAALCAEDLLAMATQEGATWRPGTVRWDTRKSGGFELMQQVQTLLRGHPVGFLISVQRSWLPQLGVRPVFAVIGGVIAYRKGAWVVDMSLAGFATYGGGNSSPLYVKQHAITWEEADDGSDSLGELVWSDDTIPNTWHETVTYEDLGHVGQGLTAASVGPDQGYDR